MVGYKQKLNFLLTSLKMSDHVIEPLEFIDTDTVSHPPGILRQITFLKDMHRNLWQDEQSQDSGISSSPQLDKHDSMSWADDEDLYCELKYHVMNLKKLSRHVWQDAKPIECDLEMVKQVFRQLFENDELQEDFLQILMQDDKPEIIFDVDREECASNGECSECKLSGQDETANRADVGTCTESQNVHEAEAASDKGRKGNCGIV